MTGFGERVRAVFAAQGPLCVGIDPHAALLADWGLPASAAGARELGLRTVAAAAGRVGIVKPQVAFFEQYGSAGFAALEAVTRAARDTGLLVIADAKRGDIGSTMAGYARAWLEPGSDLEADALTVSPYLGPDSLAETAAFAKAHGKGLFVLCATSNPEATALQAGTVGAGTTARFVADRIAALDTREPHLWGDLGLVVGATVRRDDLGLMQGFDATAPILAPGFGAQGARPEDLERIFGDLSSFVIASESRSILSAGPDRIAEVITARAELYTRSHGRTPDATRG
ncbi:orotidine 5'-phosphate decarboxylase [Microbacterium mangrovi]|uniref:Orotidine-5'-phosphate decarboxylase n=1 Tax=Microbacterium mangrovi TaxID=1348253 RepID=A0A0B2A9Z9_9MICO|nr:orotidine-5'-phosphate decarboxylase [Microbacterium mangrovi]KHK98382.1 orotidine 5'-phosphate decarboxylase [Microbacterium mangrovi]